MIVLLIVLLLAVASSGAAEDTAALKSGVFEPARLAPGFSLPASNGTEFTLGGHRGKLLVLGFGFTHCPNVCPTTLANLAQMRKRLGALAEDVQVVYVTVDPERDDAARLQEYLALFDASFIGVTGTPDQLADVRRDYGVTATREAAADPASGYFVHHSSSIYLIDREGRLRALVPFGKSVDDIVHDVKILLEQ